MSTAPSPISLFCLHGMGGKPEEFDLLQEQLPNQSLAALAYVTETLAQGPLNFTTIDQYLAQTLPSQPAWLVGYSQGGRVALHFASHHASRVAGLILIGTQPGLRSGLARQQRQEQDQQWIDQLQEQGIASFWQKWKNQELFKQQVDHSLPCPQEVEASLKYLSPGHMPDLWPSIAHFSFPIHYLHGANDSKYQNIASQILQQSKQSTIHCIEDAWHAPHRDNPQATAQVIADIFSGGTDTPLEKC